MVWATGSPESDSWPVLGIGEADTRRGDSDNSGCGIGGSERVTLSGHQPRFSMLQIRHGGRTTNVCARRREDHTGYVGHGIYIHTATSVFQGIALLSTPTTGGGIGALF